MTLKASTGTAVMPVLSQMILDNLVFDRAALCLGVKTPGFWYHSLRISKIEEKRTGHGQRSVILKYTRSLTNIKYEL